jgi:nuclear transcription factor Y gamma
MSNSGSSDMDDDDEMEIDSSQHTSKKTKLSSSPLLSGASAPPPIVVPPPPVPPPTPDSATMKGINAKLEAMWAEQKREVMALKSDSKTAFKHQSDLPLARIKRVMKSDEDVRMISAEAPILFAKACEMFVLDLTIRCYAYSEHNKRGGLEREDVYQVLKETDIFDFLAEVSYSHLNRERATD